MSPRWRRNDMSARAHIGHFHYNAQSLEHTHTHTHTFNGPFSRTTQVSRYQKGKTNLEFTEARDSEWQRHQLGHMQVCISLQTDNHASTPPLSFYRPGALSAAQPTASKHWSHQSTHLYSDEHLLNRHDCKYRYGHADWISAPASCRRCSIS